MDRVFSARVSEKVVRRIGALARRLRTSKKAVLERAVLELAERLEREEEMDVLDHSHGVWKRREKPARTVARAREAFRASMKRHDH